MEHLEHYRVSGRKLPRPTLPSNANQQPAQTSGRLPRLIQNRRVSPSVVRWFR